MNWIPNSFRRRKLYDDLSDEMRLHLEERVEHLIGEGLSPEEAQRHARVAFGNLAMLEERSRAVWQWPTLESNMGRRSPRASSAPEVPRICVRGGGDAGLSYRSQHSGVCSIERAGAAPLERSRR